MTNNNNIIFNEKTGRSGDIGEIILNRPKALNALDNDMCRDLFLQLVKWAKANHIKAVIIKGEGSRAFCAGGDIRALYDLKEAEIELQRQFFWHEYRLNSVLHDFPKPYISLLDGITMGGGAGVSIHGSHRIATENFSFAMPETKIGFYPDIGASYFLNKCPGKTGYYLGLSGATINQAEAYHLGLVTHVVNQSRLIELEEALLHTAFNSNDFPTVTKIIEQFNLHPEPSDFRFHQEHIDECFNEDSIEAILTSLKESSHKWCHTVAKALETRSPTGLKITLERLRRADSMSFDEIMQMDFDTTQQCLQTHDFYEGVRAIIIDKDQSPQWNPKALSKIKNKDIDDYLKPKGVILKEEPSFF